MEEHFKLIESRLERIETKLDDHLERVTRTEESVQGLRGYMNIVTGLVMALISAALAAINWR